MALEASYSAYRLQLYTTHSYYTLIGVPFNASKRKIDNILFKLCKLLDPGNDNSDFFTIQWTDFNKITAVFYNELRLRNYNAIHHLSFYSFNNHCLVKIFTDYSLSAISSITFIQTYWKIHPSNLYTLYHYQFTSPMVCVLFMLLCCP